MTYMLIGLLIGLLLGWAGQRSRFCVQNAISSVIMAGDTSMLKIVIAAIAVFSLVNLIGFEYKP